MVQLLKQKLEEVSFPGRGRRCLNGRPTEPLRSV